MSLYQDLRPSSFDEMVGNEGVIAGLRSMLLSPMRTHVFLLQGSTGCLHGDMKVFDPVDKSNLSVRDRWEEGKMFHVFSLDEEGNLVIGEALPPVRYSPDRMFRVETPESVVYVTSEHQFLLETGEFLSLKELIGKQFELFPLLSSWDIFQIAQCQDVPRCLRIGEGFLESYLSYSHFCDERLQRDQGVDLEVFPLSNGAQKHTPVLSHGDVQACRGEHIHHYMSFPPSMLDCLPPSQQNHEDEFEFESYGGNNKCSGDSCGEKERCHLMSFPLCKIGTQAGLSGSVLRGSVFLDRHQLAWVPPFYRFTSSSTIIQSIQEIGKHEYFDFHVPFFHNYWSEGLFHHNCGKTTLARILAKELGCSQHDLAEYNAANTRGIDTVREIAEMAVTPPFWGKVRVFVIDECSQLTRPAQEGLLKVLEECPAYCYFFLCGASSSASSFS